MPGIHALFPIDLLIETCRNFCQWVVEVKRLIPELGKSLMLVERCGRFIDRMYHDHRNSDIFSNAKHFRK